MTEAGWELFQQHVRAEGCRGRVSLVESYIAVLICVFRMAKVVGMQITMVGSTKASSLASSCC